MEQLEQAKFDFENTDTSFRKLADKFGKSHSHWRRMAKKNKWIKFKKEEVKKEEIAIISDAGENNEKPKYQILSDIGARKLREIVAYLGDLYSPVDEPLIFLFATTYQRSMKLEKLVQDEGEVITSPLKGTKYFNPTYSALLATNGQLAKLGNDLGLSVISRKRNSLPFGSESGEPTIFDRIQGIMDGE